MNNLRRSSLTLCAVLCTACVYAMPLIAQETYTAEYIHIVLENCKGKALENISVLLYNEDNVFTDVLTPTYVKDEQRWETKTPRSFNVPDRFVSLRDEKRRTGCAKATRKPTPQGNFSSIAQFVFKCDEFVDAWPTLTITNDVDLPVSTFRDFPGDVACEESSGGELEFVAWEKETVYVQFGKPGKLPYEYYDLMIRDGAIQGKAIQQGESDVTGGEVLQQLTVRAGRGGGNAVTIRSENLDKSIKVVLKVK